MRKGEQRRADILRAAEEMFYRKGYEKTTVNEIIEALSLSKGGFYHHFDSKEALLQAICDRKADESYEAALEAVRSCPGTWADRFNAMFDQYGMWKPGNADFMGLLIRVAYREDNLVMLKQDVAQIEASDLSEVDKRTKLTEKLSYIRRNTEILQRFETQKEQTTE